MKSVALIVLQLTAMSLGQRFGKIHRTPVGVQANDLAARQQAAYQQQGQLAVAPVADPYSQAAAAAVNQQYYYPQAKQQNNNYLQQEQQLRLQLQQAQLQQLQQLQLQQRLPQQPQQYQSAQQARAPEVNQQFSQEYLQGLHVQRQQLQAQQQEQQVLLAQQQYYQQKPLFQPAPGPQVYETPENNQLNAAYSSNPTEIQQTLPSKATPLQQTQNPLGVLYSSAADTSRFQFSGNGISYSF